MSSLDPNTARLIVETRADALPVLKKGYSGDHRKYAFRYKLLNPNGRHIAIAAADTRDPSTEGTRAGVTVYINKLSRSLEFFPTEFTERFLPGVKVTKSYPRGSSGSTGDKGLSSAAAGLETLDPRDHDVLRLSVADRTAFQRLLDWYAGVIRFSDTTTHLQSSLDATGTEAKETPVVSPSEDAAPIVAGFEEPAISPFSDEGPTPLPHDALSDEESRIMADPERRRIIECHAVDLAIAHYKAKDFFVRELGKPFDLECHPQSDAASERRVVHVEVKGTVGSGTKVHLTRNEVKDAQCSGAWRSDLFIVSGISLGRNSTNDEWRASGGSIRWFPDWTPDDADLTPTDYDYRVPVQRREGTL